MRKKILHIFTILMLTVFTFSCDKNDYQTSDSTYKYSKTILVKNDGAILDVLIETNDKELLNTTFEIESIFELSENNEVVVNEEYTNDEVDQQISDLRITFIKLEPNKNAYGLRIKPIIPQNKQKTIYTRTSEFNWYDPSFSSLSVRLTNDYKLNAVFKKKLTNLGLWKLIFDTEISGTGATAPGNVPEDFYKLRLKVHYTRATWTIDYFN